MECRILFHDKTFAEFDWCKLDQSSGAVSGSGTAPASELKALCQDAGKVLVFINQQDLLLTSPQLPPRANKQQLNAIAYTVEEQLADDIENCFFATASQQPDHSVPVAVISRQIMDDCEQLLAKNHLQTRDIIPQLYLCPWTEEEGVLASLCPVDEGYLIRYGKHDGLYCHQAVLKQVLGLLRQQQGGDKSRLQLYSGDSLPELDVDGLAIQRKPDIDLLAQPLDLQSVINLKQKEYQSSQQWLGLLKMWKWPVAAMLLLSVAVIAGNLINSWQQQEIYNRLLVEQKKLLETRLPIKVTNAEPKKQLIDYLAKNKAAQGQGGFLDLLHEYSRLKTEFSAIKNDKILYQNNRLVVNLESKDLKSLESLRARLDQSKFPAQIENININPDKTTGRLIMAAN